MRTSQQRKNYYKQYRKNKTEHHEEASNSPSESGSTEGRSQAGCSLIPRRPLLAAGIRGKAQGEASVAGRWGLNQSAAALLSQRQVNQSQRSEETVKPKDGPRLNPRAAPANRTTVTADGEDPARTAGCKPDAESSESLRKRPVTERLGRCLGSVAAAAEQPAAGATTNKSKVRSSEWGAESSRSC